METIKVGIVGAGRGGHLVPSFRFQEGVEVTAMCDLDEKVLAARADLFDVSTRLTDFRALLDSDVDLVVVATPMQLHVPQSLKALAAGKHVFSEVTAAVSVDQCKELLAGDLAGRSERLYIRVASAGSGTRVVRRRLSSRVPGLPRERTSCRPRTRARGLDIHALQDKQRRFDQNPSRHAFQPSARAELFHVTGNARLL